MQQQRLNNATTTSQQMQRNYACGTNKATTPFAKVIFDLTGYIPLRLRNNRATAPFYSHHNFYHFNNHQV